MSSMHDTLPSTNSSSHPLQLACRATNTRDGPGTRNDWSLLPEPIQRQRVAGRQSLLAVSAISKSNHAGSARKSVLDDTILNGEENTID